MTIRKIAFIRAGYAIRSRIMHKQGGTGLAGSGRIVRNLSTRVDLTAYNDFSKTRLITRKLLETWYAEKTERVFRERLDVCFGLFDYAALPSLGIRKLKKRWGSYLEKPHRIILNQDLIRASKAQIDYVIVHEMCHVRHKQHNKAFRALLESKLPNWEKLKTELELKLLA